jgi:hypothetical protein
VATKAITFLTLCFCLMTLVSCEGEQGPVGPPGPVSTSVVLAFGDIDSDPVGVHYAGPQGVTVTVSHVAIGAFEVTVDGTFPDTAGVLIVTLSSVQEANNDDRMSNAWIEGWSNTQIIFRVNIWDISEDALSDDDFSFVLLGD